MDTTPPPRDANDSDTLTTDVEPAPKKRTWNKPIIYMMTYVDVTSTGPHIVDTNEANKYAPTGS